MLKAYLWPVYVLVYHLQGEKKKSFKEQSCLINNSFLLAIFNCHFVLPVDGTLMEICRTYALVCALTF